MTSTFIGYVPNYCECNGTKFEFNSTEELLAYKLFDKWSKHRDFIKFCFNNHGDVYVLTDHELILLGRVSGSVALDAVMENITIDRIEQQYEQDLAAFKNWTPETVATVEGKR